MILVVHKWFFDPSSSINNVVPKAQLKLFAKQKVLTPPSPPKKLVAANFNCCLVVSFSSSPAIPMTLMGLSAASSCMAEPWWLTIRSDTFLICSITVVITTLANGINWPKMSQMSIILMYAVEGNLSITAMKMVVMTNIEVRFTVTEASK